MESTTTTDAVETKPVDVLGKFADLYDVDEFRKLNEEMTFAEYLERCQQTPSLARNAFQYVYDMIMEKGTANFERYRKTHKKYKFFDDPETPVFGLEESLSALVDFIHGAAGGYGTQSRVLLLHGPVGSSKSTICRRLKRGLEQYSRTKAGSWYTFRWTNLPVVADENGPAVYINTDEVCPMNENPIKLMPMQMRVEFLKNLNEIARNQASDEDKDSLYRYTSEGDLNPRCKLFMSMLLKRYNGDWRKVVENHIRVVRKVHSETDRTGIGTFQPKDEKNQDATELTGDMNFSKIGQFGSDSDPRAFNYDGEFEIANRGVCEFIEMLKLDNAFLYDLLGATQEHQIKPKKFAQVYVDELIIGHTNNPEFERLKGNQFMEALRDRTVKVDIPYLLRWSDEKAVYNSTYGPGKVRQHVMPHTIEIAALFAVLTRLKDEAGNKLDLRDKAKLYDGQSLPGWTEDSVKELQDRHPGEGMETGLSARYVQDKIAVCLAKHKDYVNVFHVMRELKEGLTTSSLLTNKEDIARYEYCADAAIKELDEILKKEVQRALVADEKAIERLCNKYIDNVLAYVNNEKMTNQITGGKMDPDERLMRSIEAKAEIPEQGCDDFRRSLAAFMGTLSRRQQPFRWDSNPELKRALEGKIFEDIKDTIKLSALTKEAGELDPDLQEKVDAIKTRLIKNYGYNDKSATDVLDYVSAIFARGDISNE